MNPLQKCKDHSSQQFGRLRSNRFGKNGLTDACRAAFSKQAAPRSHAFLSCHEAPPPGTCCGELRGGLSSRLSGVESLKHRSQQRRSRPAGSIGRCGGSYCRRPGSARGKQATADCKSAATTSICCNRTFRPARDDFCIDAEKFVVNLLPANAAETKWLRLIRRKQSSRT